MWVCRWYEREYEGMFGLCSWRGMKWVVRDVEICL